MEIVYVIIGITCALLLILIGVIVGISASISEFYKEAIPMVKKCAKLMDPMTEMYKKMFEDFED